MSIFPIALFHIQNQLGIFWFDNIGFFSLPHLWLTRFNQVSIFIFPPLSSFLSFLVNYFLNINPIGLFAASNFVVFPHYLGLLYLWELFTVLLAIFVIIKKISRREYKLLLLWLILFPIPAAFTSIVFIHPRRIINAIPLLSIVSAIGLVYGMDYIKSRWQEFKLGFQRYYIIAFCGFVIVNILGALGYFYLWYQNEYNRISLAADRDVVEYIKGEYKKYERIMIVRTQEMCHLPYISVLYYWPWDPNNFSPVRVKTEDLIEVGSFDKFEYFYAPAKYLLPLRADTLYIVPQGLEKGLENLVPKKVFYYPRGDVAYRAY